MKPLFLRRLKSDADKSIPPKKEIFLYAELSKLQRDLYKSLLLKDISALKNNYANNKLHNVVIQTRKCCSHPYLFDGVEEGPPYTTDQHIVDCCGKMIVLDKLIDRLRPEGHRCLVFCQFIKTLDILEDYLMWKNLEYFRLDGNTELEMSKYNTIVFKTRIIKNLKFI
jgi:SWI/SNF-related matrix-associated actin-dependent regulator of chromatin subfamily A member 5